MNLFSRHLPSVGSAVLLSFCMGLQSPAQAPSASKIETISVNTKAPTTPFPHFWEQTFGSGRAILSLRQDYREDLRTVKQATDFKSVRFHGIFMDDVGLYDPDRKPIKFAQMTNAEAAPEASDAGIYNFSYIDHIYDGLLANGVRPFVELSFMPKKMASDPNALHAFWYKQNVSPPKDYKLWDDMITAFAQHLVDRYGIDEVAQWDFEVWNEPNIDFWGGNPKQPTYFELYDHTARAIKKVNSRLRVGGPSTAQAAWVAAFLDHCKQNNIPVDFVSTHVYGNDTAKNVLGTDENIPRDRMVCRAVKMVHNEITASPYPKIPLIMSEYNASYANEPDVTDSIYMGPWLATTISQCDGLTQSMSYWSFSDVFEEQGVVRTPFYGGFGLLAEDDIPKPALNAFAMLHHLGDRRIKLDSDSALATRSADGSIAVALWNYAAPYGTGAAYTPPPATAAPSKTFILKLEGAASTAPIEIWRLDADHGNVLKTYDAMGRPAFPSRDQIAKLREAGKPSPPEASSLKNGSLTIAIPPQGLVLVKLGGKATD
ncbi:glycosyl hydrolase family 39 [Edaphobacter paludis]|uniref:Glycosyl hydrolase family 39 n=1 Tax=Edaphobacter paludis TaxID=3035702 RepID=A0AAU7CYT9_9BACT